MSPAPRPINRPSRISPRNGSQDQPDRSPTGTVSKCPLSEPRPGRPGVDHAHHRRAAEEGLYEVDLSASRTQLRVDQRRQLPLVGPRIGAVDLDVAADALDQTAVVD